MMDTNETQRQYADRINRQLMGLEDDLPLGPIAGHVIGPSGS